MRRLNFDNIPVTARRVKLSSGHLRRISPTLALTGLARKERRGPGKANWFIRRDWRAESDAGPTVVTINIHTPGHFIIDVNGSGSKPV